MQYAKDNKTGRVIHVRQFDGGEEEGRYTCPLCRMRVRHVAPRKKHPHFAHWPGEGRPECELYTPSTDELDAGASAAAAGAHTVADRWEEIAPAAKPAGAKHSRVAASDGLAAWAEAAEDREETEPDDTPIAAAEFAGALDEPAEAVDGTPGGGPEPDPWEEEEPGLFDDPPPTTPVESSDVPAEAAAPAPVAAESLAPTPPPGGWGTDPAWANSYGDDDLYSTSARATHLVETAPDRPLGSADFLFEGLNSRQREAVMATEGPVLVVAGAGSGKTRVITRRIANLLVQGVPPWRITALTFTNKAAGEMRRRIETLIQDRGWNIPAQEIWMSTFHSICARLLRREAHHLGLERSFSIYDEDDVDTLLKQVLENASQRIDYHEFRKPSTLRRIISEVKNGTKPLEGFEFHPSGRIFKGLFDAYNQALRANNACDFDDLLLLVVKLFHEHPAVRENYARRFRYVLIDEFQDTNPIQYEIVKALGSVHRNICATGDPDQSIYGWRGADIRNILNFEHDFPDTRQVVLDQNYRSTQQILDAASAVIGRNKQRKEKRLYSDLGAGEEPVVMEVGDEIGEAEVIAREIQQRKAAGGRNRDCAVFYRINAQSGPIEQALVQQGIPYVIVGGTAFYQRKEVKDALAYLRLAANPSDDISFQRVVNFPRRKIGPGAVELLENFAKQHQLSLLAALRHSEAPAVLGGKYKPFAGFLELIDRIAKAGAKNRAVRDAVTVAIHDTGLMKEYTQQDDETLRTENLIELVNAAERFDQTRDGHGTLVGFLENVALVSQVDRWDSDSDHVTLMTVHMAKGLEFPFVWIAGLEDGLFPLVRQDEDPYDNKKIEEERRLMYVAITRARQGLTILHAEMRMRYGRRTPARGSRFLDELPAEGVRYVQAEARRRLEDDGWRIDRNQPLFGARPGAGGGFRPPPAQVALPAKSAADQISDDRFGRSVEWEPDAEGLSNSMRASARKRAGLSADADAAEGESDAGDVADNSAAAGDFSPAFGRRPAAPAGTGKAGRGVGSSEDSGALLTFEDLEAGLRISHKQYNTGVIVSVEDPQERHPKVIIKFDKYGEKEFSGRLVQLWRE